MEGNMARISPTHSGPREPAGVPALTHTPLGLEPPLAQDPFTAGGLAGTERPLPGPLLAAWVFEHDPPPQRPLPATWFPKTEFLPTPRPLQAMWVLEPESHNLKSPPVGPGSLSATPDRASSGCMDPGSMSATPLQGLLQLHWSLWLLAWACTSADLCGHKCSRPASGTDTGERNTVHPETSLEVLEINWGAKCRT